MSSQEDQAWGWAEGGPWDHFCFAQHSTLSALAWAALTWALLDREVLQVSCRQTLEVTRTALLFLSSSLGAER